MSGEVSEGADEPEASSKGCRADVHLIVAEIDAGVNFMLAADQVEIVFERVDVRSTLEGRVAAIAEGPIAAGNFSGNQAFTVWSTGVGGTAGSSPDRRSEFQQDGGGCAGEVTRRSDVVEDAVVADGGLIERVGREHVVPAEADVACVVDEVLIAAEGVGFGKSGRAAGHKGEGLVVAETAEEIVLAGERVVQPDIEFGIVQAADRLVDVVVAGIGAAGVDKIRGVNVYHAPCQCCRSGLDRGILLQAVPWAWLPSAAAGKGFPEPSHWK